MKTLKTIIMTLLTVAAVFASGRPACDEFATDWEDMTLGDTYYVGDSFTTYGVNISTSVFYLIDGSPYTLGSTMVGENGMTNGSGYFMIVNNINLEMEIGLAPNHMELLFGDYGGSINLSINGDHRNFYDMATVDGTVVGGVSVTLVGGGAGSYGTLVLDSSTDIISQFSIGGQQFSIDDICYHESGPGTLPPLGSCETLATDWEDMTLGNVYNVGDVFTSELVTVTAQDFIWLDGTPTSGGYTEVGNGGYAGGSGLEIQVNNISLGLELGGSVGYMEILFGEYGGNLNLEINGDFRNFSDFAAMSGLTVGGVDVYVVNGFGSDSGVLILSANLDQINHVTIGGQELWIDDICYDELTTLPGPGGCEHIATEWEDTFVGDTYLVGDVFTSGMVTASLLDFILADGTPTAGGHLVIDNSGMANGMAHELRVNTIGLNLGFSGTPGFVEILFGEYGGNLNLEINGDFRNFDDFVAVDGLTIGGVDVAVTNGYGNDAGVLTLTANLDVINHLTLGGQELWIDDICTDLLVPGSGTLCDELATDWEDQVLGDINIFGDTFMTYAVTVTCEPFEYGDGTLNYGGHTVIQNGGMANGSGLEIMVNNISVDLDFGIDVDYMEILFGEYGGNLNLEINGDFRNFDDFAAVNGLTIGGVDVAVSGGYGADAGVLYLTSNLDDIRQFRVGGQELWLDDICYTPLTAPVMPGDVDGSGEIDIVDVVTTIGIIVGNIEPTDDEEMAADFNGDGNVDVSDIVMIIACILDSDLSRAALEAAEIAVSPDSVSLETEGLALGLELTVSGNFEITETDLPGGCELYSGNEVILIVSLDGTPLANGKLFGYSGDLKVENAVAAGAGGNGITVKITGNTSNPSKVTAWPNPFNPQTTIGYELSAPGQVTVDIFNIQGQLVERLVNEYTPAGNYQVVWNAEKYSSGVFFSRITLGNQTTVQKLFLVK